MRTPTWDILIPTLPHRHEKLVALLDTLKPQIQQGVRVIVYRDNLEMPYGPKCEALAQASAAEYISFLSDDDSVSPDFVKRIRAALRQNPDYVGFRVRYTVDGVPQQPIVHSLQYDGWVNTPNLIYRDITHFNPIRRELALQARFTGHANTDGDWANDLRTLGCVKTEAFIDEEIHYYQWHPDDFILTGRQPMPLNEIPPLPGYLFVTYIPESA